MQLIIGLILGTWFGILVAAVIGEEHNDKG